MSRSLPLRRRPRLRQRRLQQRQQSRRHQPTLTTSLRSRRSRGSWGQSGGRGCRGWSCCCEAEAVDKRQGLRGAHQPRSSEVGDRQLAHDSHDNTNDNHVEVKAARSLRERLRAPREPRVLKSQTRTQQTRSDEETARGRRRRRRVADATTGVHGRIIIIMRMQRPSPVNAPTSTF